MSKKKKIIAAVCAASVVCLAAVVTGFSVLSGDGPFTGRVTDDAGNGIANVSVTDGRNVVKTDKNGAIAFTAPYIGKGAQAVESTPVINGNEIIFGTSDGYIYRVGKTSGKILQKYDAGSPVFGKVIVSGASLIAGTLDGKVVCFS